ncbi:MAG TPA: 3-phosphoshikimate 1-carboxyvinyltransferase, partial [Rhodospirillales bacterium]|nr:3-phosphoshikimate 1-carboxyvinyltransferase [Rhodospirillales bacterium]
WLNAASSGISWLESEDVLATATALNTFGAQAIREDDGKWRVFGRGVGGLSEPSGVLDMGNSGTAARLLMGVSATLPFNTTFSGDASLSKRPMERAMIPLRQMGAQFTARDGGCLPITVSGAQAPIPITYELPMASAQVKTAVLLAGLNTPGLTTVIEPQPTRDHSERMLAHFGAEVVVEDTPDGGRRISLTGQPELTGHGVIVPGDFSSAAFPMVAALLAPKSRITLSGVGINPLRTGLLETLLEMGASIGVENRRSLSGEEAADLVVESSALKGITVSPSRAPSMIDEYPVLAVAAALAEGETRLEGLAELRVKESDRLGAMAKGLAAAGVDVTETEDSLTIRGGGAKHPGGVQIEAHLDHRIAMAFLVLGLATERLISIDDAATIDSSFPGFAALMNGLGADIKECP